MTKQIDKEIEDLVIADRTNGMSYASIESKYAQYGVTVKWCKRVCKDIKVIKIESSPQRAVAAILPLATRPIGVKPSEYFPILKEAYGVVYDEEAGYHKLNMTAAQKSYMRSQVKEKAQKQGKVAHFIPEWLDRTDPEFCNQVMMMCAQSLYDSFEEQVNFFLSMFPELAEGKGKGYSIRNELFSLVVSGYDPSGVHNRCQRNQDAVEFLSNNPDIEYKPTKNMKERLEETVVETESSLETWDSILADMGY